jgi:hypothetical protein
MHAIVAAAVFVLCGEKIAFDRDLTPQFTPNQSLNTSAATRDGLVRWAATDHGRALIEHLRGEIRVTEDWAEGGAGRAPEPGIATLTSMGERVYTVILNPSFVLPAGMVPMPNQPATPADMMAAAWAGEMLHVDFYSRGISLPHHQRDDFQEEWSAVAGELGFPTLRHEDDDERQFRRRRAVVRIIGRH